jgi:hypothetical protein
MANLRDFLLAQGVMEVAQWRNLDARGVSADGLTIVGAGVSPRGTEGWAATIPEPSSIELVTLAAAFALFASGLKAARC